MSSSSLTMIKKDGEIILAHLYSFRGYPEEMGLYYLHLLRKDGGLKLKEKLCNYNVMDERAYAKYCLFGFAPDEEALQRDFPSFVLGGGDEMVKRLLSDKEAISRNQIQYAYTGDVCWGYLIDYDQSTYEIYKGFNRVPLNVTERFYNDGKRMGKFYPIRMMKEYHIKALPTNEIFIADLAEE